MLIPITPTFKCAVKKLHPRKNPILMKPCAPLPPTRNSGVARAGDLQGVRIYKFRLSNPLCRLAYRILEGNSLKLLNFGPHENFYRDLKQNEKG